MAEVGFSATWSVPIHVNGAVIGVLNLATYLPAEPGQQLETILGTLGRLIGSTFERIRAQARAATAVRLFIDGSPVLQLSVDLRGYIQQVSLFGAESLGFSARRFDRSMLFSAAPCRPKRRDLDSRRPVVLFASGAGRQPGG